MIKTAVLTISDSCSKGQREDISGQTIRNILTEHGFEVCEKRIVADDRDKIISELIDFSDRPGLDVLFTTGGTGLGPRDVTPEATIAVSEKIVYGLGELMRLKGLESTPNAVLSRGVAVTRKKTLIINLPGSPRAVRECLELIIGILPHAVEMMHGGGH
jgi:molybdenum cofactor synthesis domain-containing protein